MASQYENAAWFKKLTGLVTEIDKDPEFIKGSEAQAFGFCSVCKNPVDQEQISEMSDIQKIELKITGMCRICQEKVDGPNATELISEFMEILENEKKAKRNPELNNPTKSEKKKFDNEEDIIDEDFL